MSDVPQTDVSRPSALPTAKLLQRQSQPTIDQKSNEYLDAIEEEWNKRVDVEIETLVDGMADIVGLASVRAYLSPRLTVTDLACRGPCGCGMWDAGWADRRQGQVPHRPGGVPGAMPRRVYGASLHRHSLIRCPHLPHLIPCVCVPPAHPTLPTTDGLLAFRGRATTAAAPTIPPKPACTAADPRGELAHVDDPFDEASPAPLRRVADREAPRRRAARRPGGEGGRTEAGRGPAGRAAALKQGRRRARRQHGYELNCARPR